MPGSSSETGTARDVLVRMADWLGTVFEKLTDAQIREMLETEHGGIMEVVADVYAITGDARYLALAKRLNHQSLFEPMARGEDVLTGLHANAQIPKVIGMERIYQLTGEPDFGRAARFFWDNVVHTRSFVIGGHGENEFFFAPDAFATKGVTSTTGPGDLQHLQHGQALAPAVAGRAVGCHRRLHRAGALQPHPRFAGAGARRVRLLHLHASRPLPDLLERHGGLLVLHRHRHGEPRQVRRVHLRPFGQPAVGRPPHPLGARLGGTGSDGPAGHALPGGRQGHPHASRRRSRASWRSPSAARAG